MILGKDMKQRQMTEIQTKQNAKVVKDRSSGRVVDIAETEVDANGDHQHRDQAWHHPRPSGDDAKKVKRMPEALQG